MSSIPEILTVVSVVWFELDSFITVPISQLDSPISEVSTDIHLTM